MTPSLSKVIINDVGYTKRNKRCIPEEGMPHAHKACQKKEEKKRRQKDNPHPWKIKERDGSWKGVHTPSTQKEKNIYITTHLHILIKVYDLFLFGSSLWLNNTSKASMPLYFFPELHISLIKMIGEKKVKTLPWWGSKTKRVIRENNLRSKTILSFQKNKKMKTQVSKQEQLGTWILHRSILQLPKKAW